MARLWSSTRTFLEMIKVTHTIFALPLAVGAAFLAERRPPELLVIGKIVLAVLYARTAAMSFNRLADRRLDAENPRTRMRALPRGDLSPPFVILVTLLSLAGVVATAWWINTLALTLSPVAILILLGYSLTKHFTLFCHFFLGLALGLAPVGAWLAVTGSLSWEPWLLGGAVLLWTAGFDILYACMDVDSDRRLGLHSIPAKLGVRGALRVSGVLHLIMVGVLILLWQGADLGPVFLGAVLVVFALLAYEHKIVAPDDLSRVNRAFFTLNGVISAILMLAMIVEALLD